MRGVTMSVATPVTFAVILCLGTTILDATYLERPLWLADKGRQQTVSYGNANTRPSQFLPANEPSWIVPEPYRTGGVNLEWAETAPIRNQPTQDSPNTAQKVREERPPYESYETDKAYEYQAMYQGQASQPAWMNQQQQQQQQQVEYQKPYSAQEQAQPEPEYYATYGGQQQQSWNREPVPESSPVNELYQQNQPMPDTDTKMPFDQHKPEQTSEPVPSKPEEQSSNTAPLRPQEVQQSYNPYLARPEMYQPAPAYVEPQYQLPYYGQQPYPALSGSEQYQMQKPGYKQPAFQPFKPVEETNKVRKPIQQESQTEQVAPPNANLGYYAYQPQAGWYSYQQNPLQAAVQTEPEVRVGDAVLSLYPMPSVQGAYDREPVAEKPKPQVQQRPSVQKVPERLPSYQPNRIPSNGWEAPYEPLLPAPMQPKPRPQQQRPAVVEPTYNRRPETSHWDDGDDDDEVVVKYEKPVTRIDARCPRDDNPAKPVHFPSATSCVKFQKCFNGIAYEMSCPPGLEFDAKSNRCDYPARARCSL